MSDVVAVALITGGTTGFTALVTAALAVIRERWRSEGDTKRLKEQLRSEERRILVDAIRHRRLQEADQLQNWTKHNVAMSIDVGFMMLRPYAPEHHALLMEQLDKLTAAAAESSINVLLSQFSDEALCAKMRRIHGITRRVNAELVDVRLHLTPEPLGAQELEELKRRLAPVEGRCAELDHEIVQLNAMVEKYVMGLDIEVPEIPA